MKKYARITANAVAYYSENTYYEEVFLPLDVWDEIKDQVEASSVYISELDGKHSEVEADIDVDFFSEEELATYLPSELDDGEVLYYHIDEYLDKEKYDSNYLSNIHEEVIALRQVETLTIKFKSQDKDKIMELLDGYLL